MAKEKQLTVDGVIKKVEAEEELTYDEEFFYLTKVLKLTDEEATFMMTRDSLEEPGTIID